MIKVDLTKEKIDIVPQTYTPKNQSSLKKYDLNHFKFAQITQ